MKKILFTILILCSAQLFAGGLSTSNYNYINDLVGGRATGMAGAYTAISDDPAGLYYNPAGSVFAPNNQISLSVNSFKSKQSVYKEVIGSNDYVQDVSSFYPSFFGVAQSFGNFKLGFSFVNINNEILDQDSVFENLSIGIDTNGDGVSDKPYPATFSMKYNITENTLLAGPSIAAFITDTVSIGATIYGLRRTRQEISFQTVSYEAGTAAAPATEYNSLSSTYITESIVGIRPVIGLQYMPTSYLALGISSMFGFVFDHEYDNSILSEAQRYNTSGELVTIISESSGSGTYSDSGLPTVVRTGVAYFPSRKFIVSSDLIVHIGSKNYNEDAETTINGAIGSEYYVTSSFPVRTGIFTNFANTPELSSNKAGQDAHVNLLGFTGSASWETRNSSITLSGMYQSSNYFGVKPLGGGQSQPYSDNNTSTRDFDVTIYTVSLTGSAKY